MKYGRHDAKQPELWGLGFIRVGPLYLSHAHSRNGRGRVGTIISLSAWRRTFSFEWAAR